MTSEGCFIPIDSSCEQLSNNQIEEFYTSITEKK